MKRYRDLSGFSFFPPFFVVNYIKIKLSTLLIDYGTTMPDRSDLPPKGSRSEEIVAPLIHSSIYGYSFIFSFIIS